MTDEKNLSTFEEGSEDFAAMFAAQEAGTVRLQLGQKVTGTIITITGDSVFVDVGIKLDGIMDRKDILDAEGNEFTVRSVATCVYAKEPVPSGTGSLYGIIDYFAGKYTLRVTNREAAF